jgi:hydrogenase maturation protease
MSDKSIIILGVGNLLLGDEGVGIHVVRQLQSMPLPPEVEVIDGGTGGFELLAHCRGKKKVIIVDAMNIAAEPGAVFRFAPEELPEQCRPAFSAHEGGLHELLHFCKTLVPPPEVLIYGVAPQETQRMSTQLSEMLAHRLDEIVALLAAEMERAVASDKQAKSA